MSTPQQDPKRREPGYYHVRNVQTWHIACWDGDEWDTFRNRYPVDDSYFTEIDECRIERVERVEILPEDGVTVNVFEKIKQIEKEDNSKAIDEHIREHLTPKQ